MGPCFEKLKRLFTENGLSVMIQKENIVWIKSYIFSGWGPRGGLLSGPIFRETKAVVY